MHAIRIADLNFFLGIHYLTTFSSVQDLILAMTYFSGNRIDFDTPANEVNASNANLSTTDISLSSDGKDANCCF